MSSMISKKVSKRLFLEEEDELSWEDIQRLTAAFVVCVLGTAAHKGSIFWTSMFFLSIILCGIWWHLIKLIKSFIQSPNPNRLTPNINITMNSRNCSLLPFVATFQTGQMTRLNHF